MTLLYNIAAYLMYVAFCSVAPFHQKAKKWLAGRKNLFKSLEKEFRENKSSVMWMHCSSLGEFEQGRPLLEAVRKHYPCYKLLLTFYSPSGYEVRKNYEGVDYICYLPLDTTANARKFIEIVNPKLVLWIKYEFWPNILSNVYKQNIPIYLVSGIFRPDQLFFKSYGGFYRKILLNFQHLFVQNEESLQLLNSIEINNTSLSGDTRFDRVKEIASNTIDYPIVQEFAKDSPVLILGSSWPKDEKVVKLALENLPNLKLIIVPHEIEEDRLVEIETRFSDYRSLRYTLSNNKVLDNYNLLIVDTMGMLSVLYKYAQVAYIGCGFDDGIHNILEAAVYGKPTVFGPNYEKFYEAKELVNLGGAISISSPEKLAKVLHKLYSDSDYLRHCSDVSFQYVHNQKNATSLILEAINI